MINLLKYFYTFLIPLFIILLPEEIEAAFVFYFRKHLTFRRALTIFPSTFPIIISNIFAIHHCQVAYYRNLIMHGGCMQSCAPCLWAFEI